MTRFTWVALFRFKARTPVITVFPKVSAILFLVRIDCFLTSFNDEVQKKHVPVHAEFLHL